MRKIIFVLVSAAILVLLNGPAIVQAEDMPEDSTATSGAAESTNVGNKICPVSGDKINEETKATYEYDGKIYNFCCASCIEEFKKDPQKYIKKVEDELQAEPKEGMAKEKETMPEGETMQGMHEGHQHSR